MSGLLMVICGDVIRPGLAWMLTRNLKYLVPVMAQMRDPGGFARLGALAGLGPPASLEDAQHAATRIATMLACKGGVISDITVGDCVDLADTQRPVHAHGGQRKVDFYLRLRALGIFPADAPATIRAFGMAQGQHMLKLAASIAAGTPVSLSDALTGIDRRNASLLETAILRANGQRP